MSVSKLFSTISSNNLFNNTPNIFVKFFAYVNGKIGKQVLQKYSKQMGGNWFTNFAKPQGRRAADTLDTKKACLVSIPDGANEDCYNNYAPGHPIRHMCNDGELEGKPIYRLKRGVSGGYGDQCKTKFVHKTNERISATRDAAMRIGKATKNATMSGYTATRDAAMSGYTATRDAAMSGYTATRDAAMNSVPMHKAKLIQVRKKIAHLDNQIRRIDSHIEKYNNCKDPLGTIRTDALECMNLRCKKVAGRDDCITTRSKLKKELDDAKKDLNTSQQILKKKQQQRNSMFSNISMPTGMMNALRRGKQAEAEGKEALKRGHENVPVDCSKCGVFNTMKEGKGGFVSNNTNLVCQPRHEQQGGGKRRNAKRTSKKRNASKKRRNASKKNNRR